MVKHTHLCPTRRAKKLMAEEGGVMLCAKCGGKSDVVDSRPQPGGIWRRRQCRACGERWTTVESANPNDADIKRLLELLTTAAIDIDQVFRNLKKMRSRPS